VVYEELKETEAAIACHERRLELASENGLQVLLTVLHVLLVLTVHSVSGAQLTKSHRSSLL
jgi:hypothetical protein